MVTEFSVQNNTNGRRDAEPGLTGCSYPCHVRCPDSGDKSPERSKSTGMRVRPDNNFIRQTNALAQNLVTDSRTDIIERNVLPLCKVPEHTLKVCRR